LLSATEEGGGRCAVSRGPRVKKLFTYLNFCSLQRFNTAKESEQPGSFYLVGELRKLLFPRANLRHFVLRFTITRSLIDNNMRWALWGESSIGSDLRMYRRPISLSHPQRKKGNYENFFGRSAATRVQIPKKVEMVNDSKLYNCIVVSFTRNIHRYAPTEFVKILIYRFKNYYSITI